MILLTMLLVTCGSAAVASRAAVPLLVFITVGIPMMYVLTGFEWLDNKLGLTPIMVTSWQTLSGVDSPTQIMNDSACTDFSRDPLTGLFAMIFGIAVLLLMLAVMAVSGLAAIIATPLGVIGSLVGGLIALTTASREFATKALIVLSIGAGGIVIFGLACRVAGWTSGLKAC
jgi:hypothetical protein